jgi:CRISPR/Cas system CSM-associated protein Csm4 (group 5 of RAMP superfamily)
VLEEQKEEQEEEEAEEEEEEVVVVERGGRVEEKGGRGKSWIRYIQEGSKFKSTSFTSSHMCLSGRPHTTS